MKWNSWENRNDFRDFEVKLLSMRKLQLEATQRNIKAIKVLEEDISILLEHENLKWRQRAKANRYTMGDKDAKNFHTCATQRRRRNKII